MGLVPPEFCRKVEEKGFRFSLVGQGDGRVGLGLGWQTGERR